MKRRSLLLPTIGTIHVGAFVIVAGLLCHVASAQEPDAPAGASVLQVHDAPDQIIHVTTRIRHTTVIQLPPHENILDFVVGDSEYWHLTGAANLAFLKPIGEGVHTNVALVCESGRIFSFLVVERDAPPHLIVRVGADPDTTTPAGAAVPAFVARSRVAEYQLMAEQSREAVQIAQIDAEAQIAAMRQDAAAQVDAFRASYPTRLEFPYQLDDKALRWPFLVHGMWHDGQFTYVRSTAQETPAAALVFSVRHCDGRADRALESRPHADHRALRCVGRHELV